MERTTRVILIAVLVFLGGKCFGQELADSASIERQRIQQERSAQLNSPVQIRPDFYRKSMGLDSAGAANVASVQDAYKVSVQAVVDDSSLTDDLKRKRIDQLILERNKKLQRVLNPKQQSRIVPPNALPKLKNEHSTQ